MSVLVLSAPAFGQAVNEQAFIMNFFAPLQVCDLLEFSDDGYLNELEASYPVLTPEAIREILAYTEVQLPRPDPHWPARTHHPAEYPVLTWPMNRTFRSELAELGKAMSVAGVTLRTRDVIDFAEQYLGLALRRGLSDCYKISQMTDWSDNESVEVVALPPEAQAQIDSLFANRAGDDFSERVRAMLNDGTIDLDEARELRALRIATEIFEQNTVLRHDIGGYVGNSILYGGYVRTTCRNERQTYYFFLRRLQHRGLLRHFAVEETWAYRLNEIPIDGHNGTVFRSLRTGTLFILDSWIHDGGEPANLLTLADWYAKRDD